jgi:uncharacterized protein YlxP (DUF503 family)
MRIAVGKLTLNYWNNDSATTKHQQLDELCAQLRKKYNISILEIDHIDDPDQGVVGFAVAIPEHWKASSVQAFVEKVCKDFDSQAAARVVSEDTEILEF